MQHLTERLKTTTHKTGAALVGIAPQERLADAPPSGDPRYVLPSTQSIIAFGIPYDQAALTDFFTKTSWRPFNFDKKAITLRLYVIGDRLVDILREEGYDAVLVEINNTYRPEPGAQTVTERVTMHPDFAHRYGAVAAGLGRLGWSGNVMTPDYGAAIVLGSVLTSAPLLADPVLEDHPCDRCKMCVVSCPMGMIHPTESVTIHLAGLHEEIARKRTNNCCWIGCDGYHSLSPDHTWSNWSPYRIAHALPRDDSAIDALCTRIRKADPDASLEGFNPYTNYRAAFFDPEYLFVSVCAHCANVCWPHHRDRRLNWTDIKQSGIVVLRPTGERQAVPPAQDIVELPTAFQVKVAMIREDYEAALQGTLCISPEQAVTESDRMVLQSLQTSRAQRTKRSGGRGI